ncbi:MAG: transposase, partial [Anaerolineales bacterium]|nr:transposase [Anaerolineales bacterium]
MSKDDLFAAVSDGHDVLRFANTAAGIADAVAWLTGLEAPAVVAFEATGGFERALWEALVEAGIDARQLNPREVRAWRQSRGRHAKTDPIDAHAIAGLLASRPDAGRRLPEQRRREINALLAKRRQLVEARKSLLCQRRQHHHPVALAMDDDQIELIENQIDLLNALIEDAIADEPQLARDAQLLRSIPGVGPVISATLL